MTQQARPVLSIAVLATGAIAFARAVNVATTTAFGAIGGVQATVSGQKIVGIACRDAALGAYTEITCLGTAVCESGAAIAIGARVQCDASGRVITAVAMTATQGAIAIGTLAVAAGATAVTSTAANGAILSGVPTVGTPTLAGGDTPLYVFGTALQAAGAAGEFIEVLIGN